MTHDMAMLLIDERYKAISTKMRNADVETEHEEVLERFLELLPIMLDRMHRIQRRRGSCDIRQG